MGVDQKWPTDWQDSVFDPTRKSRRTDRIHKLAFLRSFSSMLELV
jgi:hypothetical protein